MFFNVIAKGCRAFFSTATGVKRGLEEFFEAGKALPVSPKEGQKKPVYGRAWEANELRLKSFEELHQLWWVLIKERNLLATQEQEARRLGQIWFNKHRELKCKLSMARLKTVLTERKLLHQEALKLVNQEKTLSEGDLILEANDRAIKARAEMKRKIRKMLNYRQRRQSLFI